MGYSEVSMKPIVMHLHEGQLAHDFNNDVISMWRCENAKHVCICVHDSIYNVRIGYLHSTKVSLRHC